MTKTSWLSAGLVAGLGCLLLAAAPASAQQSPEPEAPVLRGTATTVLPSLPPPTSTLDVVRRRGALRVGVSTFVPWAMNAKSGELIGFEIDVAKQLAEDLGVKAEFVPASYPNLLDDLLADRFDIIVSGMSITPARALVANFSIPVGESYVRLVASREKAAGIRTAAARPPVRLALTGVAAVLALRLAGGLAMAVAAGLPLLHGTRIDMPRLARLAFARRPRDLRAVERQHVDLAAEHALDRLQAVAFVVRDQR